MLFYFSSLHNSPISSLEVNNILFWNDHKNEKKGEKMFEPRRSWRCKQTKNWNMSTKFDFFDMFSNFNHSWSRKMFTKKYFFLGRKKELLLTQPLELCPLYKNIVNHLFHLFTGSTYRKVKHTKNKKDLLPPFRKKRIYSDPFLLENDEILGKTL